MEVLNILLIVGTFRWLMDSFSVLNFYILAIFVIGQNVFEDLITKLLQNFGALTFIYFFQDLCKEGLLQSVLHLSGLPVWLLMT